MKMEEQKLRDVEYHMQELSIAQKLQNRAWEGNVFFKLGIAYDKLFDFEKALGCYRQVLSIAKEVGDRNLEGSTYGNMGVTSQDLGNFKQAIEYHKQTLRIAKELGDRAGEGNAYGNLGNAYQGLGNSKQATEYHKQHLDIAKELGDRAGEGKAYGNLGNAYQGLGNFKQAIEYQAQHLGIAKELGDRAGEGAAYGNLGNAYRGLGNFKQAIEYNKQTLRIAKELGDRAGEGHAYGNLGNAYQCLGNCKQATEYHKQRLDIAKELGDRAGEGNAYGNLGNAYQGLGNFKQAIEYHKQHLGIAKELGDRAGEGKAYGNLGNAYGDLGNFKQATEYHKQHLDIAKELGDRAGEGNAYGNLGNAYQGLGNFKQATEYHKQRLDIAKELGDRAGEGNAYGNLGNTYQVLGNFKQATEYHKQHLDIAKELGDRAGEGNAYGNLGSAYRGLGNFKQAIECHKQTLRIAKEVGDGNREGRSYYYLGVDYESLGSWSEAVYYHRSSITSLDNTRRDLQSEDAWKIDFRHLFRNAYTALWRTLLKIEEIEEALYAAEKGRAQALTDVLQNQYDIEALPPTSLNPKETISRLLNGSSIQTVFMAFDENTATFWVLRKDAEIRLRQKEIRRKTATVLVDAVLKEIGAGVDVRCEDRSLDEPHDDAPTNTSREAVEEIVQSSFSSVNSLRLLYDAIIGPVEDLLQGEELIIVPDGPFCLAPYSALTESVRIRTVPSLTALRLITGSPEDFHSKSGSLLVGDPCMEEVPMALYQLPCAKKEVEMIGELLKTTPLTGKKATKDEVLKKISSVALVHIAAHGSQETGEIVLAPNPNRASRMPKKEDFILTMSDVQAVRLRARLVVLSCCHSGRGEVKSEGVVGIARAFLCAGARSVLVSLWAIDDEATLLFMRSFYQHLANGERVSVALHQAMKSLRESQQYCAVKYWAPFVLIGDNVTLEFAEQS